MDKEIINKLEKIHRIILNQSKKVQKLTSGNVSHDAKVSMATLMNICNYYIFPISDNTDDELLANELRTLSSEISSVADTLNSLTPSNVTENVKRSLSASMERYGAVIEKYLNGNGEIRTETSRD